MGHTLDALLGRNFKTSKFKSTVNLSLSRLAVLKNQRRARCSVARSDVVQLLNLGHHERALLRVEQVIKEQNMLDVYLMIEGYCHLLIERVSLIEHEKVCPEELKEAISSLLYTATRCGEFPELQQLRAIFISRFGKEFAARAMELRNNCGVNSKMIQKLSTRMPSLENRLKVLKEIASENGIVLQIEEASWEAPLEQEKLEADNLKQKQQKAELDVNPGDTTKPGESHLPEDFARVEDFQDQIKAQKKYKDVADAAQAAFESAAYAAAAARVAVELSRPDPRDPRNQTSPKSVRPGKIEHHREQYVGLESEKIEPIRNFQDEEIQVLTKVEESKQRESETEALSSSGAAVSPTKPIQSDIILDESYDSNETVNGQHEVTWWKSTTTVKNEDVSEWKLKPQFAEGHGRMEASHRVDGLKRPMSMRTRRGCGH